MQNFCFVVYVDNNICCDLEFTVQLSHIKPSNVIIYNKCV